VGDDGRDPRRGFPDDIKNEARELGRELAESCKSKPVFPEVEQAQSEFKERMQMLVGFRKEDWPYEYEYWPTSTNTGKSTTGWSSGAGRKPIRASNGVFDPQIAQIFTDSATQSRKD